jgi:cation:H+ antiporter
VSAAASAWLQFGLCALMIGVAGTRLSRYGDVIAGKTGMTGGWIGLALLATVTSIPELTTGVSAVALAGKPNLAIGNVLGACVLNLAMLVVVDLLHRGESFYRRAGIGHVLSASFGIVLGGFVGLNILLAREGLVPSIGHVGLYTPILIGVYLVALRTVFAFEARERRAYTEEVAEAVIDRHPGLTLRQAARRFATAGAVVVAAGLWLPFAAGQIADAMGWRQTFVGSLLLAGATTLPELAVTVAAIRLGAVDMAIGNLLGSNLFNLVVLAIDDLVWLKGPLLSDASPVHVFTSMSALVMTGIVVIGLLDRPNTRLLRTVGWISLALFTVYLLNSYVLFLHGD